MSEDKKTDLLVPVFSIDDHLADKAPQSPQHPLPMTKILSRNAQQDYRKILPEVYERLKDQGVHYFPPY